MNTRGTLTIIPIQAFILTKPSSRLFSGQMNPFIKFKLGSRECQSKTSTEKGLNPTWDEVLIIKKGSSTTLRVELVDHHTFLPNQLIGEGKISIEGVIISENLSKHQFWLKKDEIVTGKLELDIIFSASENQSKTQQDSKITEGGSPVHNQSIEENQIVQMTEKFLVIQGNQSDPDKKNHSPDKNQEELKIEKLMSEEDTQKVRQKIRILLASKEIVPPGFEESSKQAQVKKGVGMLMVPLQESQISDDCSISIAEMKWIQSQQMSNRNTAVSEVVNIRHLFFTQSNRLIETPKEEVVGAQNGIERNRMFTSGEMDELLK